MINNGSMRKNQQCSILQRNEKLNFHQRDYYYLIGKFLQKIKYKRVRSNRFLKASKHKRRMSISNQHNSNMNVPKRTWQY
mmetsp:Transcript_15237/g.34121  ORF Transcript_15237/g.34121 Transcript_15237/m.34121 type:complete len:80 (+) Transcript_15237:3149-3388(+)